MQGKKFSDFDRRISVPEDMSKILFENANCDCSYYMYFTDFKDCMSAITIKDIADKDASTSIDGDNKIPFFIYDQNGILTETKNIKFSDIVDTLTSFGKGVVSFADPDTPYTISLTTQDGFYSITSCCDYTDLLDNVTFSNGKIKVSNDGVYECSLSLVVDVAVDMNDKFEIGVFVNDTLHNKKMPFYDQSSPINVSYSGVVNASANDEIDFRVTRLSTNNVDLDIYYCMFKVYKIK